MPGLVGTLHQSGFCHSAVCRKVVIKKEKEHMTISKGN